MKEILIFAGTTEGRRLSECLSAAEIAHTLCVATEYGEIVLKEDPLAKVHRGRMDRTQMREYMKEGDFAAVADATHPYAEEVSENIRAAAEETKIPYIRINRETGGAGETNAAVTYYDTAQACAAALEKTEGNILLTTGSKDLKVYCALDRVRERLYVRILPAPDSLAACVEQGIGGGHILALQGPFNAEMNEAMIHQYRIGCLVTKESGRTGGYKAKLEAAARAGIPVLVVGRGKREQGCSFSEACRKIGELCQKAIELPDEMEIVLAGAGMGGGDDLTGEVRREIGSADILLGAERLIAPYRARLEKKPYYCAEQIVPFLEEMQESLVLEGGKAVVLFSGDSGFYSGCRILYSALQERIAAGRLRARVRILPGVSSVAYLAACIKESYQDAAIISMHGKKLPDIAGRIRRSEKTFLLTSGAEDVRLLGKALLEAGMEQCVILAGYQLSYPRQQILTLTPKECCEVRDEGLYTCFVRNPYGDFAALTHGRADGDFIREKVPMTKEEVREVSICKLKLGRRSVVYDIGSGTGSIAVEIAGLSEDIRVYAVEQNGEAARLIEKNREKFCLGNITVVEAQAPDGLLGLPAPTHAFIGGSGGRLKEILSELYRRNPRMRVVINAVSMETICGIGEILREYPVENQETVQIQVSRAKKMGEHHLMRAENPVWICAFDFCMRPE